MIDYPALQNTQIRTHNEFTSYEFFYTIHKSKHFYDYNIHMHACFRQQQSALEITQLFRAFGVKMCFLPKSLYLRAVVYVRASMRARINTIDLFIVVST